MQWTRTILDGLMMTGYFCFAAGAGVLAHPMMACNMYPKGIRKLVKPEPGHKKRALIWFYGIAFLPVLAYSVLSAYISGIHGFWNLFFTAYAELMLVNVGDFLFLDLWGRELLGERIMLPGTEDSPYYGRRLWMKTLAVPEHLILWPLVMMPILSAVMAGIGLLLR